MLAEAAVAPLVFPMDVRRRRAADADRHRPRHHRRPPAFGEGRAPDLLDGHSRLDRQLSGRGIPRQDAIHPRTVEHQLIAVERGVTVATPTATQSHATSSAARHGEGRRHLLSTDRIDYVAARARAHPIAFQLASHRGIHLHASYVLWDIGSITAIFR